MGAVAGWVPFSVGRSPGSVIRGPLPFSVVGVVAGWVVGAVVAWVVGAVVVGAVVAGVLFPRQADKSTRTSAKGKIN